MDIIDKIINEVEELYVESYGAARRAYGNVLSLLHKTIEDDSEKEYEPEQE